jgi:uncharacterized membrane protein
MRVRPWLLVPLTLLFVGVSAWALFEHGYAALWRLPFRDIGTFQIFVDLVVAVSLCLAWLVRDARRRGLSPLPYVVLTLAGGSLGPLAYLWRIERLDARAGNVTAAP